MGAGAESQARIQLQCRLAGRRCVPGHQPESIGKAEIHGVLPPAVQPVCIVEKVELLDLEIRCLECCPQAGHVQIQGKQGFQPTGLPQRRGARLRFQQGFVARISDGNGQGRKRLDPRSCGVFVS